jgi:hypothetical protein
MPRRAPWFALTAILAVACGGSTDEPAAQPSGADGAPSKGPGGCLADGRCYAAPSVEAVCSGIGNPPAAVKWIDDFEDNGNVFDTKLVHGWTVEADPGISIVGGAGAVQPTSLTPWGSHAPESFQGMRMEASIASPAEGGARGWGALWKYETDPASDRATVNFAAYSGIIIWARLTGAPGHGYMTVALPTYQTTDSTAGGDGTCTLDANCGGHYQASVEVTDTCWSPIDIHIAMLKVPYGRAPLPGLDAARVFGIELQFAGTAPTDWPVGVLVDDMYLY